MATNAEARQKIIDLVREGRICSFTTVSSGGHLVSRPMGLQQAEFDGDLWFFTDENTPEDRGTPAPASGKPRVHHQRWRMGIDLRYRRTRA